MKAKLTIPLLLALSMFTGCGYHTTGASAHLPSSVHSIAVPIFRNNTQSYHTEVAVTEAIQRELEDRTKMRVLPRGNEKSADAVLTGIITKQTVVPLTYNSTTGQSSSFLITVHASVELKDRDQRILFRNPDYVFRQQYEASSSVANFLEEDAAAIRRLSSDFASSLVSDLLESF
jgi:outer membrane lipopolysaccharide assembly protein LptE/RlpB